MLAAFVTKKRLPREPQNVSGQLRNNLKYVHAFIDYERFLSRALTPNFATNDYFGAYEKLFAGYGIKIRIIDMTRKQYPNGYSLVIVTFRSSEPDSVGFDLIRNGTLRWK